MTIRNSAPEDRELVPRLTKREWERLGSLMLPVEMGGNRKLSPKVAQKLMALGYVEACEDRIYGNGRSAVDRLPIVIKGYQMTPTGHYAFCRWAAMQPIGEAGKERT